MLLKHIPFTSKFEVKGPWAILKTTTVYSNSLFFFEFFSLLPTECTTNFTLVLSERQNMNFTVSSDDNVVGISDLIIPSPNPVNLDNNVVIKVSSTCSTYRLFTLNLDIKATSATSVIVTVKNEANPGSTFTSNQVKKIILFIGKSAPLLIILMKQ